MRNIVFELDLERERERGYRMATMYAFRLCTNDKYVAGEWLPRIHTYVRMVRVYRALRSHYRNMNWGYA